MLSQIKIIFSVMDHIMTEVPLGLPTSRSIFKNFQQNLEGKFIKSSSKTKALIHYPMGCPRRQCTPDLFIYFILATLCASGRSLWGPHGPHRALCVITSFVTSYMEFMVFKRCRYQQWQCKVGAQAVIRCAQVGTTWPQWQWRRGCCTTPTNTLIC